MDDFPEDLAIRVRNIGKTYRLGVIDRLTLRDELVYRWLRLLGRDPSGSMGLVGTRETDDTGLFHALDDVSFDIRKGETVGLIGRNGAGKSTMLKILARITTPTTGEAWIRGRVGSMLEVGTGFHPELTGRENIYLNGTILGMTKREIDDRFDEIVEFSEIGEFLDTPVKRYSSGMYVKLAFSIASSFDNDILLLDEVLAVGDAAFRKKSLARMKDIAVSGRTILFVSHSMADVMTICSRCILFDHGRVIMDGPMDEVSSAYEGGVRDPATPVSLPATHAELSNAKRSKYASGRIRFSEIRVLDETGNERDPCSGGFLAIRLSFVAQARLSSAHLSLGFRDALGRPVLSFPSIMTQARFPLSIGRHEAMLNIPKLPLTEGIYGIALYASSDDRAADIIDEAIVVSVRNGDFFNRGQALSDHLKGKIILCDHSWSVQ